VTIEIGNGTIVTGSMNNINWDNGPYFVKTQTDLNGGANYTITGTSQISSLPYALHSKSAETADYNTLTNLPILSISNWSTAYGWGNHSGLYRLISYVPSWSEITGKPTNLAGYGIIDVMKTFRPANGITATNISNWNTAFGWGNHVGLYRSVSWVPNWTDISGKPNFATVATSGSYTDLINKPTILNSQWTTNGYNIYFNSGNVGIGTSSPSEKLDVTGNIEVSGDYKYSSTKTDYYHVGCSEFAPRNGDVGTWVLHGSQEYGCFAGITGTWRSYATVHLPEGATVTEVRLYYVDCSANNMTVYFRRTSSSGLTIVDLGSATSTETDSPAAPYAHQIFFNPNVTIDNANNRYTIIFESAQNDNNHRLYNVRIKYTINQL